MLSMILASTLAVGLVDYDYYEFDHTTMVGGMRLGGLSGLTLTGDDCFAAISDSQSQPSVVNFCLGDDAIEWGESVALSDQLGTKLPVAWLDGEGIAQSANGWWVASEPTLINPTQVFNEFDETGRLLNSISIEPTPALTASANKSFEPLVLLASGDLLSALEQPTQQADYWVSQLTPLVKLDPLAGKQSIVAYYPLDVVSADVDRGLVALERFPHSEELLAVERHYELGAGNRVIFYRFKLPPPSNISELPTVEKTLWFELVDLGIDPDNIEGASFDQRGRLVLVSDNNFSKHQRTQIIRLEFSLP